MTALHHGSTVNFTSTWRIIPISKWLGSPLFISHLAHLEGESSYIGNLLTMVINHLLTGMILQVAVKCPKDPCIQRCSTRSNHGYLPSLIHVQAIFLWMHFFRHLLWLAQNPNKRTSNYHPWTPKSLAINFFDLDLLHDPRFTQEGCRTSCIDLVKCVV